MVCGVRLCSWKIGICTVCDENDHTGSACHGWSVVDKSALTNKEPRAGSEDTVKPNLTCETHEKSHKVIIVQ